MNLQVPHRTLASLVLATVALVGLSDCPGDSGDGSAEDVGSEDTTTETTTDGTADTTTDTTETTTDTSTDTTTDTTETTTDTTTGEQPPGCECVVDDPGVEDVPTPPSPLICGDDLCPMLVANYDFDLNDYALENPEDLECVLTALRDRTPGVIRWVDDDGGQFTDYGYILIAEDGGAIRRNWGAQDLSYVVSPAELGSLHLPMVYEDCLVLDMDMDKYFCAKQHLASVDLVCDEGWEYTSI